MSLYRTGRVQHSLPIVFEGRRMFQVGFVVLAISGLLIAMTSLSLWKCEC
jgi:hypothetical protein